MFVLNHHTFNVCRQFCVMILEKYKPNKIEDLVNKEAAKELKELILKRKKFIITGSTSSGKSLSLELIAKDLKYQLINITEEISDKETMKQKSMFYRAKIFSIDMDSIKSLDKLDDFLDCPYSVALCSDDIYQKRYYEIRKKYQLVKFRKISDFYIINIVKRICTQENIPYDEIAIGKFVSLYNGDIRAVLINLECLRTGITIESIKQLEECKSSNVFDVLTEIFNGDLKKSIRALSDMDQDILPWIEENVVDGKSLACNQLVARADLFKSRIRKTGNWSLDKYYYDFLGGISTLKTGKRMFNPPFSKRTFKRVSKN